MLAVKFMLSQLSGTVSGIDRYGPRFQYWAWCFKGKTFKNNINVEFFGQFSDKIYAKFQDKADKKTLLLGSRKKKTRYLSSSYKKTNSAKC